MKAPNHRGRLHVAGEARQRDACRKCSLRVTSAYAKAGNHIFGIERAANKITLKFRQPKLLTGERSLWNFQRFKKLDYLVGGRFYPGFFRPGV